MHDSIEDDGASQIQYLNAVAKLHNHNNQGSKLLRMKTLEDN